MRPFYRILSVAAVLAILAAVLWTAPGLAQLYFQAQGGRLLAEAFKQAGRSGQETFACSRNEITDESSRQVARQAIQVLEKAHTAHSYLLQGRAYCLLGNYEAAIDAYAEYIRIKPNNPLGQLESGFAYEHINQREKAAQLWFQISVTPDDFINTGNQHRRAGNSFGAIEAYQRAEMMGADLQSLKWYLDFENLKADGEEEAAYATLGKAVHYDQGWADEKMRFLAWYQYGVWLQLAGKSGEAEPILEKAITLYTSEFHQPSLLSEAYRFLGGAQWSQDRLEEALINLEKAMKTDSESNWAKIHYGKVLRLLDPTRRQETSELFHAVLARNPDKPEMWSNLIDFWRRVGDTDEIESLCKSVPVEINTDPLIIASCSPR